MFGPRKRTGPPAGSRRQATNVECMREQDIVDAIASGRWPHAGDPLLETHAAACEICRDVVTVAVALREDAFCARHEINAARLPSAGLVLWRATIRARAEATRVAQRPLTVPHGIAGACPVGVAGGVARVAVPAVQPFRRVGE